MCKAAEIDERLHCLQQQSQASGCRGRFNAPTKTRSIAIKNTDALRYTDTSVIVSLVYITVILLVGDKIFVVQEKQEIAPRSSSNVLRL